jgi:purine-nucleoside phosphorylase
MTESRSYRYLEELARGAPPQVALVLGSGMSDLVPGLENACSIPFAEVPGMPSSTVAGHRGCITLGQWCGKRVLIFAGRLHYYEGYPWRAVVLPVEVARYLGAKILLMTNAAGGIHEDLAAGSLMAIRDHIEWTRPQAWLQVGPGALGPQRPSPYSPRLLRVLQQAAQVKGMTLHQGTYASVTGPCYETPAEIRALRAWGADAVGMSTAREIQAGRDAGLECGAISCITNRAAGLTGAPLNHEEVLAMAATQRDRLAALLEGVLGLL